MELSIFIITAFTFIDDWFQEKAPELRQRGPQPTMHDKEVMTIEVVGAFLGMDTDKAIFGYFRRHWGAWFPGLRQIHRTTYVRQSANLWQVKALLWQTLLKQIALDPAFSIADSFPIPICRFARANRCRRLRENSAYGYDEVARQTFFGVRAHLHICWPGVIVGLGIAPADVYEMAVAEDMLADRNYWNPELSLRLDEHDLHLFAPYKSAKRKKTPWPRWLKHKRYRIETVIGQLSECFQAKKIWARDIWHFWSRWLRRILNHTFAAYLCQQNGISSLRFAELVAD